MKDRIILIEDDPHQSASIKAAVESHYRNVEVEVLETESEFCERVAGMTLNGPKPSMIICDIMLPWAFPEAGAPKAPPDVGEGTFCKAGVRCWERLRKREDLRSVPWIFFTVLDERTIEFEKHRDDKTAYVQKSGSMEPLLQKIQEWTRARE